VSKGPKHNLPTVSSDIPRDLRLFIDRVAESLSGNGEDRFVTAKELASAGVYDPTDTTTDAGGTDPGGVIPVLTPPKPTLTATAGYEYVVLEWPTPSYYGHSSTTVYRNLHSADAPTPTFDDSNTVAVTSVSGFTSVFSDYLGTGQTATYFIQFVNINNVEGPVSDPVTRTTAIDVAEVIDVLEGQLTSTQFVNDLSTFQSGGAPYLVNALNSYVVKLNADGFAAGFGLSNTGPSGNPQFDFAVLADSFFITPPVTFNQPNRPTAGVSKEDVWRDNNATPVEYYVALRDNPASLDDWREINPAPFIVRTTDKLVTNSDNRSTVVPAGVYIRDGYIQNGTITNATIGEAAIDTAKIQDATITTAKVGDLDAGRIVTGVLKSPNFTNEPNKAGFFLSMGVTNSSYAGITLLDDGTPEKDLDGNLTHNYIREPNQEDVQFILRGASDTFPALQLINGVVTINALAIRRELKSVSFDNNRSSRGFKIDLGTSGAGEDPGGFVHFRDNAGEDVFRIDETADGKGVVKMTAAAIRDAITSYNFDINAANITTPGFHLGIGQKFDGTVENTKFYLYGKNGKLLFGVDGNTEQLSDRIANSAFISNQLANAQNINPFMTEPDFSKDDVIRPRGWYLTGSARDGDLTYNTANELTGYPANTVLKLKSENNNDNAIGALSAAIRRDPKVSEYSVVITWRVENAAIPLDNGGLYFRAFTTSDEDFPVGQNVVTPPSSGYSYVFNNDEPTIVEAMANSRAANLFVVEDTYSGSGRGADNDYQNVGMTSTNVPSHLDDLYFHTTKLKIRFTGTHADTTYFSLEVLNWIGLGVRAALYIDKVVVTPIALDVDASDVTNNGTSLSDSTFAWLTEKIKSSNITTYFDTAAITETIIGRASVGTLKIQDNAVTVPQVLSLPVTKFAQQGIEHLITPTPLVLDYGTDPKLVPSKVLFFVTVELGANGFGGDWGAATVRLRFRHGNVQITDSNILGTAVVEALQQNGRKGAPPSLVFSATMDGFTGPRTFYLTLQVGGEHGSASNWWRAKAGNLTVLAAKR